MDKTEKQAETTTTDTNGYETGLSLQAYQNMPGLSRSDINYLIKSPAMFRWYRDAPESPNKNKTLDIGSAVHTKLLEPQEFNNRYIRGLDRARAKNVDKEAWAEFEAEHEDKTIISVKELTQIELMARSAWAHPEVAWLLEETNTLVEVSMRGHERETSTLLKARPDIFNYRYGILADVKTIDKMQNWRLNSYLFNYWLQDAHYSKVSELATGIATRDFFFIVISKSLALRRYEVRVFHYEPDERTAFAEEWRAALRLYHTCQESGGWPGVEFMPKISQKG